MIDTPPVIRLLTALHDDAAAIDYVAQTGVAGVTIRHQRNRNTTARELPCGAIEFVSDEPFDGEESNPSSWEKRRALTVNLVFDTELAAEDSGDDQTGYGRLLLLAAATVKAWQTYGSRISLLSDAVSMIDNSPSDESQPDKGRLVTSSLVVYRVRSDDENVLLAEGANA